MAKTWCDAHDILVDYELYETQEWARVVADCCPPREWPPKMERGTKTGRAGRPRKAR